MQIILDQEAAEHLFGEWQKWERIALERENFPNWRRSPIERENRRESVVYSNCASYLDWILRNAVDENGSDWWPKLYRPEVR